MRAGFELKFISDEELQVDGGAREVLHSTELLH